MMAPTWTPQTRTLRTAPTTLTGRATIIMLRLLLHKHSLITVNNHVIVMSSFTLYVIIIIVSTFNTLACNHGVEPPLVLTVYISSVFLQIASSFWGLCKLKRRENNKYKKPGAFSEKAVFGRLNKNEKSEKLGKARKSGKKKVTKKIYIHNTGEYSLFGFDNS